MTEVIRAFVEGDSVISLCSLTAPPVEPPGTPAEIPSGSRGTVRDVREYNYPKPYVVAFEVEDGGVVEIDVAEHQLGRVASHGPILPPSMPSLTLRVRVPNRYEPTVRHPHRWCKLTHAVNMVLLAGAYGAAAALALMPTLMVTAVVLLAGYYHQFSTYHQWKWMPLFTMPAPREGEQVVYSHKDAQIAVFMDAVFALCMTALLTYHFVNTVAGYRKGLVAYVVLLIVTALVLAAKSVFHNRAAAIYTTYD